MRCFSCESYHDQRSLQTVCGDCGLPLRVDVDLDGISPQSIDVSDETMWRYQSVLPVPAEARISLGEGWTPILQIEDGVYLKDESGNPTGSFKDRGMSMAVSAAALLGVERLVAPSAGNAGVALAAYGKKAGIPVLVAMPEDTPERIVSLCRARDATVQLVAGDISTAGRWLEAHRSTGDFDVSTLKEPYRVEGKKTMGYEVWEQFGRSLPDVVIYPTGGGTGLVGMWKAWDEMEEMGWIGEARPRLVAAQASGCAPVVKAWTDGKADIEPWPDPLTTAWGLRVPSPIAGFLCLRALSETEGHAVAVPESDLHHAANALAERTGVDVCPEGGAAWAALGMLRERGAIRPEETVLVWNTGSGSNYR